MKRLSKEILDLRRWLREAQQQNKEMSHDVTKKVKEVERKERIILEKNEKIRKVSQEVESTRLEIKRVKSNTINKQKGKVWISKNV
jgi:small-conductance mechanosensitive channel